MDKKEMESLPEKLNDKRHSLAHLLAAAVLELYPEAKITLGPAIDVGFYYDIDFGPKDTGTKISDKDLPKIEKKMKEILPSWKGFESREVTADDAREI